MRYTLLAALLFTMTAVSSPAGAARAESVQLELGFGGAVVANAWNPLRLVLRDLPPVVLELRLDAGSLRSGPQMVQYRAQVAASHGLQVYDDVLYIPAWRSLTWTVRSTNRTLASGAIDSREVDARPLTLLVSSRAGGLLSLLPGESRAVEAASASLPRGAAAFAGVEALLIDGSASPPASEAVVAAAAGGARVVLVEPLPPSHAELLRLAENGPKRIGAGWIAAARTESAAALVSTLPGFPGTEASVLLAGAESVTSPPALARGTLTLAGFAYALVVIILVRFAGNAGVATSLVLAGLVAAGSWLLLRPEHALIERESTLSLAAGQIALSLPTLALRSLPGGEVLIQRRLRPLGSTRYRSGADATEIALDRWQRELLLGRPFLASAEFEWQGGLLVNSGNQLLEDMVVVGLGRQPPLPPGARQTPLPSEDTTIPEAYNGLAEFLPDGSALARSGTKILVALPTVTGGEL